jgi:hypothetical protein
MRSLQMTKFNEELRKIVTDVHKANCTWHTQLCEKNIDQAISAITKLVKEVIPAKRISEYTRDEGVFKWETQVENKGFNSCRSEILKRLD